MSDDERIEALLEELEWPASPEVIFTGNVLIDACVYDENDAFLADVEAEFDGG